MTHQYESSVMLMAIAISNFKAAFLLFANGLVFARYFYFDCPAIAKLCSEPVFTF
jgi:hypothetical protein